MICIILMKFTSCKTLHQICGRLGLGLVLLPLAWGQSLARLKEGGVVHRARALASNQAEDESQQQVKVFGISQPNVCHCSNIMKPLRTMDFWLRSTFPQDWCYLESTLAAVVNEEPFWGMNKLASMCLLYILVHLAQLVHLACTLFAHAYRCPIKRLFVNEKQSVIVLNSINSTIAKTN